MKRLLFLVFIPTLLLFSWPQMTLSEPVPPNSHAKIPTSSREFDRQIILNIYMGGRHKEQVIFRTQNIDQQLAPIISYLLDGRTIASRLVPDQTFRRLVKQFYRLVPMGATVSNVSWAHCQEAFFTSPRSPAGGEMSDQICFDKRTTLERRLMVDWWHKVRELLEI